MHGEESISPSKTPCNGASPTSKGGATIIAEKSYHTTIIHVSHMDITSPFPAPPNIGPNDDEFNSGASPKRSIKQLPKRLKANNGNHTAAKQHNNSIRIFNQQQKISLPMNPLNFTTDLKTQLRLLKTSSQTGTALALKEPHQSVQSPNNNDIIPVLTQFQSRLGGNKSSMRMSSLKKKRRNIDLITDQ